MIGSRTCTRQLVLVAATLTALQIAGPASAADGEAAFMEALLAYEAGNFPVAETHLKAATQQGHRQAHEILGIMYAVGPSLYAGIARDSAGAVRHFESAASLGSMVSRYLLCALVHQPGHGQPQARACARTVVQPPSHIVLGNLPYESD